VAAPWPCGAAARISLGLFFALGAIGCDSGAIGSDWQRLEPPVAAADFTLPGLDGKAVSLSDYRGRLVIMEFWATWCGPCRSSLPSLEAIFRRYHDRGVTVLLVNQEETPERIRRWAGKRFTAPILLDESGDVAGRYRVEGIPQLFIIDQEGKIVYRHDGYGGGLERSLELILQELLPQPPSTDHV